MQLNTGNLAARSLNKLHISAEYGPEIAFVTAMARIAGGHVILLKRLDKLIRVANAQPARPGAKDGQPAPRPA